MSIDWEQELMCELKLYIENISKQIYGCPSSEYVLGKDDAFDIVLCSLTKLLNNHEFRKKIYLEGK